MSSFHLFRVRAHGAAREDDIEVPSVIGAPTAWMFAGLVVVLAVIGLIFTLALNADEDDIANHAVATAQAQPGAPSTHP